MKSVEPLPLVRFALCIAVGVGWLAWSSPAWSAGLFASEMTTARSLGTAGVGNVTNAWDASALVSNPAGLSGIEDSQWIVGLQGAYLDAKVHTSQPESDRQDGSTFTPVPAAFYAHRLSPKAVLGVSLHSPGGAGLDFGRTWSGHYFLNDVALAYLNLTAGLSYAFNDQISVGAAVIGQYLQLDMKSSIDTLVGKDGKLKLESYSVAPGLSLGVMLHPFEPMRIGLFYSSPIHHNLDTDLDIKGVGLDPELPFPPLPLPGIDGSRLKSIELDTPAVYQVGLSYQIGERLELMAHYAYQEWEKFGESRVTIRGVGHPRVDAGYNNTYEFGVAARYQFPKWAGYVGLNYAEEMVNSSNRTITLPIDDAYKLGIGAEIPLKNGKVLGLGYTYTLMGQARLSQYKPIDRSILTAHFDRYALHILGASLRF